MNKNGNNLKPIKLIPVIKDYIWGGDSLKKYFNVKSDSETVAEAWLLSVHKDGSSFLESGETLFDFLRKNPSFIGKSAKKLDKFPMLIKLIDAEASLSVQVHPDDAYALKHEGDYGKTELWYVADCKEGAYLYFGFNRDLTKEELEKSIEDNTLTEILNRVPVTKGDTFFISAGTVHAIGAGIVICEIQQNSNITYRVYDYGRCDKNGKARELHIKKAVETVKLEKTEISDVINRKCKKKKFSGYSEAFLGGCEYFNSKLLEIEGHAALETTSDSFGSIVVIENECEIIGNGNAVNAKKGESVFLPAGIKYEIIGKCTVILSYV